MDWKHIFDSIDQMMLILGPDHTILDVNQATVRATGTTRDHLIGRTCRAVFHHACPAADGCPLEQCVATGAPSTGTATLELSGTTFHTTCAPLKDSAGTPEAYILTAYTLPPPCHHSNDSNRNFRKIFEAVHDAIFLFHADGTLVDVNPAAAEMYGYSVQVLRTMNVLDLIPPHRQGELLLFWFPL